MESRRPYYLARINVNKGMVLDDVERRVSQACQQMLSFQQGNELSRIIVTSRLMDTVNKSMRGLPALGDPG